MEKRGRGPRIGGNNAFTSGLPKKVSFYKEERGEKNGRRKG